MKERTIQVLKYFIQREEFLSLEFVATSFQISVRTLRNELKEVNEFLTTKGFPEIQNVRKRGLKLFLSFEQKPELLEHLENVEKQIYFSPEERCFDLILSIVLGEKPTYLYEKENSYQVSKSTMDEDIRKVRQFLLTYQIEVIYIPKRGLVLSGAERSIRTMIFDLINQTCGAVDYRVKPTDESIVEKILFSYIPKNIYRMLDEVYDHTISSQFEHVYRRQFLNFTAIWLSRYFLGHTVAKMHPENSMFEETEIMCFVEKVIQIFTVRPPVYELKYLLFILGTLNPKNMNNSIEWGQAQLLTIQLIQHVEKETQIPFTRREERLYEGLYKHLTGLLHRMKNNLQVTNPLKETIQMNYPDIYRSVSTFVSKIEELVKKRMTKDEIAFLTIYFSTSESKLNQEMYFFYKVAVICNHGMATARLLAENLKERFNVEIVAVLSSRELEILKKIDVDLLFSTLRIDHQNQPVLQLDPIIRENDKGRIQAFLDQHSEVRRVVNRTRDSTNLFVSVLQIIEQSGGVLSTDVYKKLENTFETYEVKINKEAIQPMLKDILNESEILLNITALSWEEAIQKVSQPLVAQKVIHSKYISAMIDSVHTFGPYIVIGKHIALAHARPEDGVERLGVSVATLDPPVPFGNIDNDPVAILFCLAAVDSYSHLNIMKNLVDLINDEEKIQRLTQVKNTKEFQQILFS